MEPRFLGRPAFSQDTSPTKITASPLLTMIVIRRFKGYVTFIAERKQLNFNDMKIIIIIIRPPLWSSGQSFWLQIQRCRVRFPALPDFLSSSGSGTGPTQPREVN